MKQTYKIEIWQYHSIVETFESDNVKKVLAWYRCNWVGCYLNGGCSYYVYKNSKRLSSDEIYKLGFED